MKISLIVPTKDRIAWLEECIDSVRIQKHTDWEMIIIDEKTADVSAKETVSSYNDDRLLYMVSDKKEEIYAINKGFKKATGDLVSFIGDDDLLYDNNSFSDRNAIFEELEKYNIEVLFTQGINIKLNGIVRDKINVSRVCPAFVCNKYYIHSIAMMWKRSIFDRIGYWNEDIFHCTDQDWKWRTTMECNCIGRNIPTIKHRIHPNQSCVKNKTNGEIWGERALIRSIMKKRYEKLFRDSSG